MLNKDFTNIKSSTFLGLHLEIDTTYIESNTTFTTVQNNMEVTRVSYFEEWVMASESMKVVKLLTALQMQKLFEEILSLYSKGDGG